METQEDLRRELDLSSALTIGVGTMVGAGIFLLAGLAVEEAGPAAIVSYLAAGAVCLVTAASTAELATGMPTSGGPYFFVSRALGPVVGGLAGVGTWLSLTVAIAFYLVGLGDFLEELTGLPPLASAVVGGVALTVLNVVGARVSGRAQVIVVVILLAILGLFVAGGAFEVDPGNLSPFAPFGFAPVGPTIALVFVSFLGFAQIAAVAEEIQDPDRNLPRALIGSVAIVTVLYVLIVVIIAGIFSQSRIVAVPDPLTQAARSIAGSPGGLAILLAGLLATISSANASIMASSRISLALARDRIFPQALSRIHRRFATPTAAITLTGVLALGFLAIGNLEELARLASSLQLVGYAALNVACVVLRTARPEWYSPTFRTPGTPYVQVLAAVACLAIVVFSGPLAIIAVFVVALAIVAWYFAVGRRHVEVAHAGSDFRSRYAGLGVRSLFVPAPADGSKEAEATPLERAPEPQGPRRVVVALANPSTEQSLMRMGRFLATGRERGGAVLGVHLVSVPLQTPLPEARERFGEQRQIAEDIEAVERDSATPSDGPLGETTVEAITDVAHEIPGGLIGESRAVGADLLLMGWKGAFTPSRIYNSPLQRVLGELDADVAVLKDRGIGPTPGAILVPWGGGPHATLALEVAVRLARVGGRPADVLRIVRPDVDPERERQKVEPQLSALVREEGTEWVRLRIEVAEQVSSGIQEAAATGDYDLVVVGASNEWGLRSVLFGTIPDIVADHASCSVLMVRRQLPPHWTQRMSLQFKRAKESAGMTTSPQER